MSISFVSDKANKEIKQKKGFPKCLNFLKDIKSIFYYALLLLVIGFLFYIFHYMNNSGVIDWGGDYTAQYFVMGFHSYDLWKELFTTGSIPLWDKTIYLGANTIAANAYYGLFSPYNLFLLFFPRNFVPWTLSIASIIKLMVAGLCFRAYMKKMGVKESTARIAGIAYAFCGYMCFYLWYNNYQDVFSFFPLVLLGVEKVLQEKKPWVLMIGTSLCLLSNFVMAVTFLLCAFIYALFRFFQKVRKYTAIENLKFLGIGFIGFFTGICIASIVFVPSMMSTLSSPKVEGSWYLGSLEEALKAGDFGKFLQYLFDWRICQDQHKRALGMRVYYPVMEFFFIPTTCRSMNLLQISTWDFDDLSSSFFMFSPTIILLIPAFVKSIYEKRISHFIAIGLFILAIFTPFAYYALQGFSNAYARWSLFFTTSTLTYVFMYIDKIKEEDKKWPIVIGYTASLFAVMVTAVIVKSLEGTYPGSYTGKVIYRLVDDNDFNFTYLALIIEAVYLTIVFIVILSLQKKNVLNRFLGGFIAIEAILCGASMYYGQGTTSLDAQWNNHTLPTNEVFKQSINKINSMDSSYYRIYSCLNDDYSANNGMLNGYGGTGYFHSIYNFYINEFTQATSMRSGDTAVGGYYLGKYQDLDNMLGIKYYILDRNKMFNKEIEESNPGKYQSNVPFNYEYKDEYSSSSFMVYENTKQEFAYTYDTYTTMDIYKYGSTDNGFRTIQNAMEFEEIPFVSETDASKMQIEAENELYPNIPSTNSLNVATMSYGASPEQEKEYNMTFYKLKESDQDIYYNPQRHLDELINIPSIAETAYPGKTTKNNLTMMMITKTDGGLFFDGKEAAIYISAVFNNEYHFNFYFIGENNKVFMFDDHNNYSTNNPNEVRGFYPTQKVKAIVIKPDYSICDFLENSMRYELKEDYDTRTSSLNQNTLTNVKNYKENKFTFNSNFNSHRMVVTKLTFDPGWKIKATDSNGVSKYINTYNADGGFVSFISLKGNASYELIYETPYSTLGRVLTGLGITGALISYAVYMFFKDLNNHDDRWFIRPNKRDKEYYKNLFI